MLVAVMVAIFGVALLALFHSQRRGAGAGGDQTRAAPESLIEQDLVGAAAMDDEADAGC